MKRRCLSAHYLVGNCPPNDQIIVCSLSTRGDLAD
jgi:hypothetical protein